MELKNEINYLYWKNWKFYYKFFAGLTTLGIVVALYISGVTNINNIGKEIEEWYRSLNKNSISLDEFIKNFDAKFSGYFRLDWINIVPIIEYEDGYQNVIDLAVSASFGEYTIYYLGYWTNISNILIGAWLLAAAFRPKKEGRGYFLGQSSTLLISTYIILTMLIFIVVLVPAAFVADIQLTWELILFGIFQHFVLPIIFLVYVCLFFRTKKILRPKTYMNKEWWKVTLFLWIYLAIILVRGEIRYRGHRPYDTQYPYFFMYIHEPKVYGMPGYAWLIIVVALIMGLCLGASLLMNTLLSKRIKHQEKNLPPELVQIQ